MAIDCARFSILGVAGAGAYYVSVCFWILGDWIMSDNLRVIKRATHGHVEIYYEDKDDQHLIVDLEDLDEFISKLELMRDGGLKDEHG